ncbi:MAG: TolC family protein [Bacteroidaceae bacterium]|nr:TolC family protein [Bacteroidaceae bacterium]
MLCIACCALCANATVSAAEHSLTITQLRDSALATNFTLRQARLHVDAAKEQHRETFTKFFPSVSATGAWFNANRPMAKMDIDPQEFISPEMGAMMAASLPAEALAALSTPMAMTMMKNGTIASISAMQPIFAGGQIVNGNKLAKVGEEASQLQVKIAENDVVEQVEQTFWQLVSLEEKTRTLNAVSEMLKSLEGDVKAAVKAGVALRNDLLQVQLRQNEIESQYLKLSNGRSLIKLLLAQYCGLRDTTFSITYDHNALEVTPVDHEQALLNTSEYQLMEKNVQVTALQRKMEVGKNLPSLAVGAGYNYHNLMECDRHFAMVYATVNVPISDWWGGSHAIRRKRIAEQEAQEQLTNNSELLKIQMQKAWNDVVEAESQLALAERSETQAEENLRLHRNTYKAGTATMSDLLEAQLLFQQALDKKTEAYISLQMAALAYRIATGS